MRDALVYRHFAQLGWPVASLTAFRLAQQKKKPLEIFILRKKNRFSLLFFQTGLFVFRA